MISGKTSLCLVIGDPIGHSLSPLIHNAAYQALGIADRFVFAAARVEPARLREAIGGVRALGIRGVSCTLPHKAAVLPLLDEVDRVAARIGAVNTIVNTDGRLAGCNTDVDGITAPLLRRTALPGKNALVIGAGGVARSAVFGLQAQGAHVTILNRWQEEASALVKESGCPLLDWEEKGRAREFDIVFHGTPVGMHPRAGEAVLEQSELRPGQLVFDAVYTPYQTELLRRAGAAGAETIHGTEMFVEQAARQFQLYTGMEAPRAVMEQVIMEQAGRD